ncbi:MAG: hypothetical protein U9N32_09575 [Spirochaetota bacterium]|nr:hypothetical protein [Spirochaetota bacterium]
MVKKCRSCKKKIDTEHDEHYFCKKHSSEITCPACYLKDHNCSICGNRLQYKDASYQKKIFFNPTSRGMLGF